jgi:hypothetical protein
MEDLYIAIAVLLILAVFQRAMYVMLFQSVFKISFKDAPVRAFLFFSAWTVLYIVLFEKYVVRIFQDVPIIGYLTLIFIVIVLFPLVFRFLRVKLGVPVWLSKTYPSQTFLSLEEQYIVSKVGDVASQQLIGGILVFMLADLGYSYTAIVLIFVVIFALSHIYLFFSSGFIWGLHYTMFATVAGFAFPFLFLFIEGGIAYSLVAHMLFYVLSAAFFAKLPRPSAAVCRDVLHDVPPWHEKVIPV